jgi:hypothetical protein
MDIVQFAGRSEAHEKVAHLGPVLGLIGQTILDELRQACMKSLTRFATVQLWEGKCLLEES